MLPEPDLGYLVTGVIERHPTDKTWVLRVTKDDGTPGYFPLEEVLRGYEGQEVRVTIATTETIARLTALVGSEIQYADGLPKSNGS